MLMARAPGTMAVTSTPPMPATEEAEARFWPGVTAFSASPAGEVPGGHGAVTLVESPGAIVTTFFNLSFGLSPGTPPPNPTSRGFRQVTMTTMVTGFEG